MRQMNHRLSLLAVTTAVGLLACASAHAQAESDYRCTIQRVGESVAPMSAESMKHEQMAMAGTTFTVDRRSGVMEGSALINSGTHQPEVVDPGSQSPATSFIALTTARRADGTGRRNSYVFLLMIAEYVKSDEKPFHFVDSLFSYHGTCVHIPRTP